MSNQLKINPYNLKKGDRIVCINMGGETSVSLGDPGTVTRVEEVGSSWTQINVKWDNGSDLSLILESDPKQQKDIWMLEDDFIEKYGEDSLNVITESMDMNDMEKVAELYEYFGEDGMDYFYDFLIVLRRSSIINMLQADQYLWMGKNNIRKFHAYVEDNDEYDRMLEMADKSQQYMVSGVISYLEDNNKEVSAENINRWLKRFDSVIASFWRRQQMKEF